MSTKKVMKGEDCMLAVIGDEDTITGFLLAGIGFVDKGQSNFFIVKKDTSYVFRNCRIR